jgi:nucleoside-diphosphate-sugar epimerase
LNVGVEQSTVLLTGASSQLGVFLIPRLLAAGFRVIALSRQASGDSTSPDERLAWRHPDSFGIGTAVGKSGLHEQVVMLISCGPIKVATESVVLCPRLERVVVFSTSSVFSKASSPDRSENQQIEDILAREAQLKILCSERGLALTILRPTLIYGCGLDRNISLLAAWIRRLGWLPLAGRATGLRQPVHADDLVGLAVNALMADKPVSLDSPACGGSTLSYRQMAELIFDALEKPRRIVSLPPWLMAVLVRFVSLLPRWRGVNREMVRRQNIDLVFDDSVLQGSLEYEPRPFKPSAADFEIPSELEKYRPGPGSGSRT